MSSHSHKQSVADAGYLFSSGQDSFFSQLSDQPESSESQSQPQPSSSHADQLFRENNEPTDYLSEPPAASMGSSAHNSPYSSYPPQLHHNTYAEENSKHATPDLQTNDSANYMYNTDPAYSQPFAPPTQYIDTTLQPSAPIVPVNETKQSQFYLQHSNPNAPTPPVIGDPYNPVHSSTTPDISQSFQSLDLGQSPPPAPPPVLQNQNPTVNELDPYAANPHSTEPLLKEYAANTFSEGSYNQQPSQPNVTSWQQPIVDDVSILMSMLFFKFSNVFHFISRVLILVPQRLVISKTI